MAKKLVFNAVSGKFDYISEETESSQWSRNGTTLNPKISTDDVEWNVLKYLDATTGGSDNLFIGENAGAGNTGAGNLAIGANTLDANSSGALNIGIGSSALSSNQSGDNNIAIGVSSLIANNSGDDNISIGRLSLTTNTEGGRMIAIGYQSLRDYGAAGAFPEHLAIGYRALISQNGGGLNFGIGNYSLFSNINGFRNTAIGREAGFSCLGSDNVFIGNSAGYSETGSNKLYISNSNTSSPLIYGEFNNDLLRINGNLQAQPTSSGGAALTLYSSDGNRSLTTTAPSDGDIFSPFIINTNNSIRYSIDNTAVLDIDSSGNFKWNPAGVDKDFRIVKNGGSTAYLYNAGTDVHSFWGRVNLENSVATTAVETVTDAAKTLDDTNHIVLCDCSSNAITVTLPTAVSNTGLTYKIKKIDVSANDVTVATTSSQTIDRASTITLITDEVIEVVSDGANWWII